ncbi:hypothetical protein HZC32_03455 [Candidatus Woesearchaeota archaeon]|nr:hypothetical protein [Candidatus Woesearchaeota archaeon]
MNIKFSLGKCKTRAAYSAKLQQKGKLDLIKIKNKYTLILETPLLLIIKLNNIEIIVHSHGELIFKRCSDLEWMEKAAQEIYEMGLK